MMIFLFSSLLALLGMKEVLKPFATIQGPPSGGGLTYRSVLVRPECVTTSRQLFLKSLNKLLVDRITLWSLICWSSFLASMTSVKVLLLQRSFLQNLPNGICMDAQNLHGCTPEMYECQQFIDSTDYWPIEWKYIQETLEVLDEAHLLLWEEILLRFCSHPHHLLKTCGG